MSKTKKPAMWLKKKRHKGLKGNEIRFLLKDALLILITKAATADNREI